MKTVFVVFLLIISQFSFAETSLPANGIYRLLTSHSECDVSLETNNESDKIYFSFISNQLTGEYCWKQKTVVFSCDSEGKCISNNSNLDSISLINERSFLLGSNKKFNFVNNDAIKSAKKVTSVSRFGYPFAEYKNHFPDCYFLMSDITIACNDTAYAQRVFCPKALNNAISVAVAPCETETGKNCSPKKQEVNVRNYVGQAYGDNLRFVELMCSATVTAEPQ